MLKEDVLDGCVCLRWFLIKDAQKVELRIDYILKNVEL